MRQKKLDIITCPKCSAEYLPAEIYLPTSFVGNPRYITKDYKGSLLDFSGESMDLKEKYICDKCNTAFKVFAKVNFKTFIDEPNDFNNDYCSPLFEQLSLFED